jgi:hypothetical protein
VKHGEHAEKVPPQPDVASIGAGVIREVDAVGLYTAQQQADQLITSIQRLTLPVPAEMCSKHRWHFHTHMSGQVITQQNKVELTLIHLLQNGLFDLLEVDWEYLGIEDGVRGHIKVFCPGCRAGC